MAEELKRLYETYYNFGGEAGTRYARLRESLLRSPVYRLWLAIDGDIAFHGRKGGGRLLDIGCNEGRGLARYRANGFEAEGLELNEVAAATARTQGFNVSTSPLEDFAPAELYDVVVLANVLEHATDPRRMLADVRRLLRNDGQVWISCPNNRSWLQTLFGRYWINWHVPFHLWHFGHASITQVLAAAGFQSIRVKDRTPALWVAQSIVARFFARPGKPTRQLRSPLFVAGLVLFIRGLLFPVLWLGNRLRRGDCLVVTARRG